MPLYTQHHRIIDGIIFIVAHFQVICIHNDMTPACAPSHGEIFSLSSFQVNENGHTTTFACSANFIIKLLYSLSLSVNLLQTLNHCGFENSTKWLVNIDAIWRAAIAANAHRAQKWNGNEIQTEKKQHLVSSTNVTNQPPSEWNIHYYLRNIIIRKCQFITFIHSPLRFTETWTLARIVSSIVCHWGDACPLAWLLFFCEFFYLYTSMCTKKASVVLDSRCYSLKNMCDRTTNVFSLFSLSLPPPLPLHSMAYIYLNCSCEMEKQFPRRCIWESLYIENSWMARGKKVIEKE